MKSTVLEDEEDDFGCLDMTRDTLNSLSKKKVNKPLMERRRRARINQSLNELKTLVLEGMNKEAKNFSRLEKADILEMAVTHLKILQKQQSSNAGPVDDQELLRRYRSGFSSCMTEVSRYLNSIKGLEPYVQTNLINHLTQSLQKRHPAATSSETDSDCSSDSPIKATVGLPSVNGVAVVPPQCIIVGNMKLVATPPLKARLRTIAPKPVVDNKTEATSSEQESNSDDSDSDAHSLDGNHNDDNDEKPGGSSDEPRDDESEGDRHNDVINENEADGEVWRPW